MRNENVQPVPSTPGIYRLEFPNGYFYVGQSVNLGKRWGDHRRSFKHGSMKLHQLKLFNVWAKYGEPVHKVLVQCEPEQLDVVEQFYIGCYWGDTKLCNTSPTAASNRGMESPKKGIKLSAEVRRRMSEGQKGRPSPNKGTTLSAATKQKISRGLKGKYLGERNAASKLTDGQAQEIRQRYLYKVKGRDSTTLAKEFGVSHKTILRIASNQTYIDA